MIIFTYIKLQGGIIYVTFHFVILNKNNKYNNNKSTIKRDVKITIGNATIYIPSDDTKSLQVIIKAVSNVEPRVNTWHAALQVLEKVLFVFCNRQQNRIKILHFDEGFWLYYHRIEHNKLKWLMTKEKVIKVNKKELSGLLKEYEVRTTSKFKSVTQKNTY